MKEINETTEINFALRVISHIIARRTAELATEKGESGLTPLQCSIIGFVCDNSDRDIYQKDIEREFGIRRSTVTETLKLMERDGLIKRVGVPCDARLKKIILSKNALANYAKAKETLNAVEERATAGLTQEEKETLLRIIAKIAKNLE